MRGSQRIQGTVSLFYISFDYMTEYFAYLILLLNDSYIL